MSTAKRKQRIREMLAAEGLVSGKAARASRPWEDFKKQVRGEFSTATPPRLEIQKPARAAGFWLWRLAPAFALLVFGVGLYLRQNPPAEQINPPVVKATERAFKRGDVYKSEKREIRFLGGNATLQEEGGKIRIAANTLKADFRLRQKVDMQIEHPLVTVTITGTEFTLDTSRKRGSINLTEGRLRIAVKSSPGAEPVLLVAPTRFEFNETSHQIKKAKPKVDRLLYRYELHNGEVFFAHQVSLDTRVHKVEILGGKVTQIAVEDILRLAPVELP
jgi:hypothetical protein